MEPNSVVFQDITASLTDFLNSRQYSRISVLVDENTEKFCYPKLGDYLPQHNVLRIPSGESEKNLGGCQTIWGQLTKLNYDRKALMINLGGGVIGDMGGFCAATFKRGIDFINIPTTLLAQVDASIGGKLGIDFNDFKNHIGVFHSPQRVLIDTEFLGTLDKRQLRSGFAEVIKHGLIADTTAWRELSSQGFEKLDWKRVVPESVEIKKKVVAEDPTEQGLRKILNYGHTIGHAIEAHFLANGGDLLHGEAIAAGMIAEAWLSNRITGLPEIDLADICSFLLNAYDKVELDSSQLDEIVERTFQDKKNVNSEVRFALLQKIGRATFDIPVESKDIRSALEFYQTCS